MVFNKVGQLVPLNCLTKLSGVKEYNMNWYIDVIKKYAVFNGRARRKEYWYFFLFNLLISFVIGFGEVLTGISDPDTGYGLFSTIYTFAVLIPGIAVSVRRLHDTNRSGWWLLIVLIPLIGAIILLVFFASDSKSDENDYGINPKLSGA